MKSYLILIFTLTLISCFNVQNKNDINGLIIDTNIKTEVLKHIIDNPKFEKYTNIVQVYENSLYVESYENDSLILSTTDFSKKLPFKSFYLWKKDTLEIHGAYGLIDGAGFYIKIVNKKAELIHQLSSAKFPSYAHKKNDNLKRLLEVPCLDTKIVLSEIPDSTKNQIIYGFVEFKSNNFYSISNKFIDQKESQKKKSRNNMKIYFRSALLK